MRPTDTLREEHDMILRVAGRAEREAGVIAQTGDMDPAVIRDLVGFFRRFVDGIHHEKEEEHFFELLKMRGMSPDCGPLPLILTEHDEGLCHLDAIEGALERPAPGAQRTASIVARHLREYVELLRSHIRQEDTVLIPWSERLFNEDDHRGLAEAFERLERRHIGDGTHQLCVDAAHRLAA